MRHGQSPFNGLPCAYCGRAMTRKGSPNQANWITKDHIIARYRGGDDRQTVLVCRSCNEDKIHLTLNEWRMALCVRYRTIHIFHFERVLVRLWYMLSVAYIGRWAYAIVR